MDPSNEIVTFATSYGASSSSSEASNCFCLFAPQCIYGQTIKKLLYALISETLAPAVRSLAMKYPKQASAIFNNPYMRQTTIHIAQSIDRSNQW